MAIKQRSIIRDNRNIPYDLDSSGEITSSGSLPEIYGKEALENALKLWFVSNQGESIRRPDRGGYLTAYLLKELSDDNAQNIKQALRDGLDIDYNQDLIITFIDVQADYDKKRWEIKLQCFSQQYKLYVDTVVYIAT